MISNQHDEAIIRWKARLEQQMASGMTQRDWCKQNRICETSFSSWKARVQSEKAQNQFQCSDSNALVDVSQLLLPVNEKPNLSPGLVESQTRVAATIEVSGFKIHVYENASSNMVTNILGVLLNAQEHAIC